MAEKRKFKLHYAGQEFELSNGDLLDGVDLGSPGTLKVNLGNGDWLTIAVGPGIPIAITEKAVRPMQVF